MNKTLIALGISVFSPLALAKPVVVTSIKPVSMVVAAIAGDKADIEQIVSNSPHDFALRPSDLKKIHNADEVVWVGESLENFLEKPLKNAGKLDSSVEWLGLNGVVLHDFSEDHHDEHEDHHDEHEDHHDDDHKDHHDEHKDHHDEHKDHHDEHKDHHDEHEEHHDGHEGHDHSGVDPHVWLLPENAKLLAAEVTKRLVYIDSDNASYYKANLAQFEKGLSATDAEIRQSLSGVKSVPYVVFHDAYTYFEEHYGLNNVGEVTVSPERKPGAKKVAEVQHKIEDLGVQCIFSEPQFSPAIVTTLLEGSKAKTAVLDPLGSGIELNQNAYITFLKTLSGQYLSCLK